MVEVGNHCSQGLHLCCQYRAFVLWLSCKSRIDVWEMFSDNTNLSANLDRQGHQGFWHKLKKKNPKIVVMSPTVETKSFKKKEVVRQQYHLCMDVAEHQIPGGKHFLTLDRIRKDSVVGKGAKSVKKKTIAHGPSCVARNPVGIFTISAIFAHSSWRLHIKSKSDSSSSTSVSAICDDQ